MNEKKLIKLGLASLLSVGLIACGGNSANNGGGEEPATENKEVTLKVWAPSEDVVENGWLSKELAAFEEAHPEWKMTWDVEGVGEDQVKEKVTTDAENAADVFLYPNDQISALLSANAIAKLGGATLDQVKSQNSASAIATVTYEGAIYGVPFTPNTWFMYYDKRVFSEEDVKSLETMLEKGVVAYPLNNSWYFAAPYVANGCTLFGEDQLDQAAGIDFSGEKGAQVTARLVELVANPNFKIDADGSGLAGLGDGSINAIFTGSWDYQNVVEKLGEENVGAAPVPTIEINGEAKQMKAFAGTKAIGVNANCENPEVAVALAAFLGSTEAQKDHYDMRNTIPTDSAVNVGDDVVAKAILDTMDYASIVQPSFPEMGNYWDPATALANEIINGQVTADNAAEKTDATNATMNGNGVE